MVDQLRTHPQYSFNPVAARSAAIVCMLALACASACGTTSSPQDPLKLVEITVQPADQELLLTGATAATLGYTATGRFEDGHSEDVTDRARFMVSNEGIGSFTGSRFTSALTQGGRTRVVAELDHVQGETGLVVRIRQTYFDPNAASLPVDPVAPFAGPTDPNRAPVVVYPNNGALVPPNLQLLEIHFRTGANNTLYEIAFQNDLTDIRVYTRCMVPVNGGCIYTPDFKVWQWIAETNRGGNALTVRTRGTDDVGSGVGTSGEVEIAFSFADVKGGIYYWKASGGSSSESAIMRYDFGDRGQTAQRFVGPPSAGGKCVGCHAVSRDGTKMFASAGGWDVEDTLLVDVKTAARAATPAKAAFASWNPDGTAYVGVYGYAGTPTHNLMVFDGTKGTLKSVIDVGATAAQSTSHPDWSHDGTSIVYVRAGLPYEGGVNNQRFYQGSIHVVGDQGGGSFGAPVEIVPAVAGKNHYYPSFAPDGQLIVFNESTCPTGVAHQDCNADSDPSATIYVVKPEPGATPIGLARANAPGATDAGTALMNSWPKWAPFEFQRTETPGSRLVWLTFSSSRNYGLRSAPASTNTESSSGMLLWMVAIDPDRVAAGEDPSYAAFCLPFQDVKTSNHIAQWTEQVITLL